MRHSFRETVEANLPDLGHYESIYRELHAHPELSNEEIHTAQYLREHLTKDASFEIHKDIGGHGFVAVYRNGPGKTVLLRADMDGLPIREETGLTFASAVQSVGTDTKASQPVMHACGHDLHMTCLLAASEILTTTLKHAYSGTLILLFQPAEERGTGAQAMVDGGLYDKIPKPDYLLGQHVVASLPAGSVGLRYGTIMAGAESMRCKLFGLGGHASQPHRTIDPAIIAANVLLRLQQIVSRELDPVDTAVVTALPLSASAAENIVPDNMEIGIDIRAVEAKTHARIRSSVERIVHAECTASGTLAPPTIQTTRTFPPTLNRKDLTKMVGSHFEDSFGDSFNRDIPVSTIAEDFPNLAQGQPYCFWHLGGGDEKAFDLSGRRDNGLPPVAMNHSSRFAPLLHPALKTGIMALTVASLACWNEELDAQHML